MRTKLPKPLFSRLSESYEPAAAGVHDCSLFDPTREAIHNSATRVSEALVLALGLASSRADVIGPFEAARKHRSGPSMSDAAPSGERNRTAMIHSFQGEGRSSLLARFDYLRFGRLCPHGLSVGAEDLGAFLTFHWGPPAQSWVKPVAEPVTLQGKKGLLVFAAVPGFFGQGHAELWSGTAVLGKAFWDARVVSFWELS